MSLKITNKATPRQLEILRSLGHDGPWDLTLEDAACYIDQLFTSKRMTYGEITQLAGDYYDCVGYTSYTEHCKEFKQ